MQLNSVLHSVTAEYLRKRNKFTGHYINVLMPNVG